MNKEQEAYMASFFPGWTTWEEDMQEWRVQSRRPDGNTIVYIPARGGSSRLKNKNIMELCGKPLISYTIELALALKGVDRVIVSTDNPEYATIAEKYGAEVPFLRPQGLARKESSIHLAYFHLLFHLGHTGYQASSIVTLLATNPFRNVSDIQRMVDASKRSGICTSVFRPPHCSAAMLNGEADGKVLFKPLGKFHGQRVSFVNIKERVLDFVENPIELIDIDNKSDFQLAQQVIENGLYDFGL